MNIRWIPIEEQLPETKDKVLIFTAGGNFSIASYCPENEWWLTQIGIIRKVSGVLAWMPLPEPYKPQILQDGAKMTVKEYATKTGLSVNELCEVTGMSRQELHDILVKGYASIESQKRMKASNNLMFCVTDLYNLEVGRAAKIYHERLKMSHLFLTIH